MPHFIGVDMMRAQPISELHESHVHPWHELILVEGGMYRASVGSERLEGQSGSVFLFSAGLAHRPQHCGDLARILLVRWQDDAEAEGRPRQSEDQTGRLRSGLMWLWEIARQQPAAPAAILDGLLAAILHEHSSSSSAYGHDSVAIAQRYMAQNFQAVFQLRDVANAVGVSPSTLTRAFHSRLGISPMAWRRRCRVETALSLLRTGNDDLKSIARAVGIASPFHLSNLIRGATGRRPNDWRSRRSPDSGAARGK